MKNILLGLACLLSTQGSHATSIAILDEGINTDFTWDARTVTEREGCRSLETNAEGDVPLSSAKLLFAGLCEDGTVFETLPLFTKAAEYKNTKSYDFQSGTETRTFTVTVRKVIDGLDRGTHGNKVSNAAWDFDKPMAANDKLIHRPWQIFGINLQSGSPRWVARHTNSEFPNENEQLNKHAIDVLNYIAIISGEPTEVGSELKELGAVNMSFGSGGTSSSTETIALCDNGVGQDAVNALYDRGIAVVVGLLNEDIPADVVTWPACLDKVIKVGSPTAFNASGRGIGVGANGLDFFAKDTANGDVGNSFAAPRVAAAYARLHKLFPFSSVSEKTNALQAADTRTATYRTKDITGTTVTLRRRYIKNTDLTEAIKYLAILYPPIDPASASVNFNDGGQYGAFFGAPRPDYRAIINFRQLQPDPKVGADAEQGKASVSGVFKAGTGILSARRDIEVSFTGVVDTSVPNYGFQLIVNGVQVGEITNFNRTNELQKTFIVNRKYLNNSDDNEIVLRPNRSDLNWGIRDISIEFLPIIPLQVGTKNTEEYGYSHTPTRYTGLRATFDLPEIIADEYTLSATGWDIDLDNETEVFVNGHFLGHLTHAPASSIYSRRDQFRLSEEILNPGATNYVEFVQREPLSGVWIGFQAEKWAVKDILVAEGGVSNNSVLVPLLMLLLNDE